MNARTQITMDRALQRRAHQRAAELGISFAEYVRRVVACDLGEPRRQPDVSSIFDLVTEGPASDIARDKDKMIAEAVWREHRRATGRMAPGKSSPATHRLKNRHR